MCLQIQDPEPECVFAGNKFRQVYLEFHFGVGDELRGRDGIERARFLPELRSAVGNHTVGVEKTVVIAEVKVVLP